MWLPFQKVKYLKTSPGDLDQIIVKCEHFEHKLVCQSEPKHLITNERETNKTNFTAINKN